MAFSLTREREAQIVNGSSGQTDDAVNDVKNVIYVSEKLAAIRSFSREVSAEGNQHKSRMYRSVCNCLAYAVRSMFACSGPILSSVIGPEAMGHAD